MLITDTVRPYVGTQRVQAAYLGDQRIAHLRTNHIVNPNMDNGTYAWGAGASPTRTIEASGGVYGGAYQRLTKTSAGAVSLLMNPSFRIPVKAGEVWTVSAFVRGTPGLQVRMRRTLAQGASTLGPTTVIQSDTAWVRISYTFTIANDDGMGVDVLSDNSTAVGDVLEVDAILAERSPQLEPYFDGSSPRAEWTGTPNASPSTLWAGG